MEVANKSLTLVMQKDALLSTNQVPLLETIPEREDTTKISLWNLSTTSSTYVSYAYYLIPLPLMCGHYKS
jgi:hypothetical protein